MERLRWIDGLVSQLFSQRWANLHEEQGLARPELRFPGVYVLAYTDAALAGMSIDVGAVFYVGMSNRHGGIRLRLNEFRRGLEKYGTHSGAMRFYREYAGNRPFSNLTDGKQFYFASLTIPCVADKRAAQPGDVRQKGHIACLEYYAIAHIAEQTGRRPALNKV